MEDYEVGADFETSLDAIWTASEDVAALLEEHGVESVVASLLGVADPEAVRAVAMSRYGEHGDLPVAAFLTGMAIGAQMRRLDETPSVEEGTTTFAGRLGVAFGLVCTVLICWLILGALVLVTQTIWRAVL